MSERLHEMNQAMSPAAVDAGVATEYETRLAGLQRLQTAERRRESVVARVKLADGALIVILAFLYVGHPQIGFALGLGAAVVGFVALLVVHERVLRSIALRERAETVL